MLCQNCGKHEATVSYTQIINGIKGEIKLCGNCANKLGVGSFQFNMPMNFADFLSDFFEGYETEMLPSFIKETVKCKRCGDTYDEFVQTGLLGCPDCYETFSDRLEPILRRLQGNIKHVGRGIRPQRTNINQTSNKESSDINSNNGIETEETKISEKDVKINKLNEDLKKAIKDERYEDAAKLRDEIKKIQEEKK